MDEKCKLKQVDGMQSVGFEPSNLAVAVMMDEANYRGRARFLENNIDRRRQAGIMLDGGDSQPNPLRDLIAQNPRSRCTGVSHPLTDICSQQTKNRFTPLSRQNEVVTDLSAAI